MTEKNKKQELTIPIVIAIIGLLSTLAGVYLGASLNLKANKEAAILVYKNELLQQRIKIIDRAAAIYGKAPGIKDIWEVYLKESYGKPGQSIKLSKTLADYNAEFNAVINLSSIYFGPKTHEALKAMCKKDSPWWMKDNELVAKYLGSMESELKHGIE